MKVRFILLLLHMSWGVLGELLQCLSDTCYKRTSGKLDSLPVACEPRNSMWNVAETGRVTVEPANATCGSPKSWFCSLKNPLSCLPCDRSRGDQSHNPDHMTDSIKWTWWQSSPRPGPPDRIFQVNITISLPKMFLITDDIVIDFYDGRPQVMMVEKSLDNGVTWSTLQYFADNCLVRFGVPAKNTKVTFSTIDEALAPFCTEDYSINHSWDNTGTTPVSIASRLEDLQILGLNRDDVCSALENNTFGLRTFLEITNLRIRLIRPPVMQWNKSNGKPSAWKTAQHYGIKKVQINARCQCNGHASHCEYGTKSAKCACQHDTSGKQCEKCRPLFWMTPWRPGSFLPKRKNGSANPCLSSYSKWYRDKWIREEMFSPTEIKSVKAFELPEPCQCNKHSERCEMVKKFGMLCVDCRHNTEGENCHRCRNRYYRNRNVPTNDTRTCTACNCNAVGSYGKWCQPRGQCNCKPRFWGRTCNKCKLGYYRVNGSCKKLPNICESAVCANLTWNADEPYTRCSHTSSGWCSCGSDMFVNCSKLSLPGRVNSQGADPSNDGGNFAPYIHRSQYFIYVGTLLYMLIHL